MHDQLHTHVLTQTSRTQSLPIGPEWVQPQEAIGIHTHTGPLSSTCPTSQSSPISGPLPTWQAPPLPIGPEWVHPQEAIVTHPIGPEWVYPQEAIGTHPIGPERVHPQEAIGTHTHTGPLSSTCPTSQSNTHLGPLPTWQAPPLALMAHREPGPMSSQTRLITHTTHQSVLTGTDPLSSSKMQVAPTTNTSQQVTNFPRRGLLDKQIAIQNKYLRIVEVPSLGVGQEGVIAKRRLLPNTSLGLYAGHITNTTHGQHTMQVRHEGQDILIDATPRHTQDHERFLGHLNEYIYVDDDADDIPTKNNVVMKPNGEFITHSKPILTGTPLTVFYGVEYDWHALICPLIKHTADTLENILTLLPQRKWISEVEEIRERYSNLANTLDSKALSQHYNEIPVTHIDGLIYHIITNKIKTSTVSTLSHPAQSHTLYHWLEALATNLPFRWHVIFRRAHSRPPPDWGALLSPPTYEQAHYALRKRKQRNYHDEQSVINYTVEMEHTSAQTSIRSNTKQKTTKQNAANTPNGEAASTASHAVLQVETPLPTQVVADAANQAESAEQPLRQQAQPRRTAQFSEELNKTRELLIREVTHPANEKDLRVLYLNVTTINDAKLKQFIVLMEDAQADIAFLTDTKCNRTVSYSLINTIRTHCPGWRFYAAPSGRDGALTGGQLVIVNDRWAPLVKGFWQDKSELGLITQLQLLVAGKTITLMGTYWPPPAEEEQTLSLWSRTLDYIKRSKRYNQTPLQYIQETIRFRITHSLQTKHTAVILGGDLNAGLYLEDWRTSEPSHKGLLPWSATCFLTPCSTERIGTLDDFASFTKNGHGISRIDHAFYTHNRGISPNPDFPLKDDIWLTLSAHRPIVVDLNIPGATNNGVHTHVIRLLKPPPIVDLNVSDWRKAPQDGMTLSPPPHIAKYQSILMGKLKNKLNAPSLSAIEASEALLKFSTESYKAARRVLKTKKGKDGWSPAFMAIEAHRIALHGVTRTIAKSKTLPQHEQENFRYREMLNITQTWTSRVKDLYPNDHESHLYHLDGGPERWLQKLTTLTIAQLETLAKDELGIVRSRSHGKQRQIMRAAATENIKKIERFRTKGRLGKLIANIMQENTPPYTLETLETDEGVTKDPATIHDYATSFFAKSWFNKPKGVPYGLHKADADMHRLLTDWEHFKSEHEGTQVPEHLLRTIWESLRKHSIPKPNQANHSLTEQIEAALAPDITMSEFLSALNETSNHTAGGITKCTYSMMKGWTQPIQEKAVEYYNAIWRERHTPDFWKWRWLCPKPKVSDGITLNDLRPLMLVECTRKMLSTIIIKRIRKVWNQTEALNHNQHAYRSKHGTDTALLQVINILEEAIETKSDLYLSSWDFKRAFDSVSKGAQVISWMRMGLPKDIAEWLVHMDTNGKTLIRSPLAQHTMLKSGYGGFQSHADVNRDIPLGDQPPTYFDCERGTGQGDVPSPPNWLAFFDILITALATETDDAFFVKGTDNLLRRAQNNAFADDMLSFAATLKGLQRKADIVSAFSIIFGMDISLPKLRLHHFNFSAHELHVADPTHLIVHTGVWEPQEVAFREDSTLKHLGVLLEAANDGIQDEQYIKTLTKLELTCKAIASRRADATDKLLALNVTVAAQTTYVGKFTNWPLKQLRTLDVPWDQAVRQITKNLPGHPKDLLHAKAIDGGLGMIPPSERAVGAKYSMLHRALIADIHTAHAARGLLARGMRKSHAHTPVHHNTHAHPYTMNGEQPIFMDNIMELYSEVGLTLTKGGIIHDLTFNSNLVDIMSKLGHPLSLQATNDLAALGCHTGYDIIIQSVHGWELLPEALQIESKLTLLKTLTQREGVTEYLKAGYCFIPSPTILRSLHIDSEELHVAEVTGLRMSTDGPDPRIVLRLYKKSTIPHRRKTDHIRLQIHPLSYPLGAGTALSVDYASIKGMQTKAWLGADIRWGKDTGSGKPHLEIPLIRTGEPSHISLPDSDLIDSLYATPDYTEWSTVAGTAIGNQTDFDIYTDGSWKNTPSAVDYTFRVNTQNTITANGAVVLLSRGDDWKTKPIHVIEITDASKIAPKAVYPVELLSITAALNISASVQNKPEVVTDSESSIKHITSRKPQRQANSPVVPLLTSARHWLKMSETTIRHVHSHQGDGKPTSQWTRDIWGNHIADRVADRDITSPTLRGLEIVHHQIGATALLTHPPTT